MQLESCGVAVSDQRTSGALPQDAARRRPFAGARNLIVAVPYLLSIPLALFMPEDVFAKWTGTKAWFDFVAQYISIVANYPSRSAFPQVTGFYFSIVVPITLCFFWVTIKIPRLVNEDRIKANRARLGFLYDVFAWFVALLLIFLAYFGLAVNPGYDFNLMPINRSRIALALFGPLFAGGLSGMCLGAGLRLSRFLFTGRG